MNKVIKNERTESFVKSIFGLIPYGGTALNELIFEYSGRIKQKRLNNFVNILAEGFTQDSNIKIENIKSEDFNDLFELILIRVVRTKSKLKLNRFKNIIIGELNKPTDQMEIVELYLDLITSLSDDEISILFHSYYYDLHYNDIHTKESSLSDTQIVLSIEEKRKLGKTSKDITLEIKETQEKLKVLKSYKTADYYNINESRFMIYKQRLFSKGLLNTPKSMEITVFGIEFLKYIRETE